MALEQIQTTIPSTETSDEVKDTSKLNTLQNDVDSEAITNLNDNPILAKEEADKIVEGLPGTLNKLTPKQQESFINYVEPHLTGLGLNLDSNVDILPDNVPTKWQEQLKTYISVRENLSQLPPDTQEKLKNVEKSAIDNLTKGAQDIFNKDK